MDTSENLPLIFIGIIVVLNVLASVPLISSPFYSRPQKLAQWAIIWLIPVIGAVGIWVFLRVQYNWQKHDASNYSQDSGYAGTQNFNSENAGGGEASGD